jgi:hypothetical protein
VDTQTLTFDSPIGEGLVGVQIEEIPPLTISERTFTKLLPLAVFQIGLTDLVHLLAAKRLRCAHFATTDSDFHDHREVIEKELGLRILFKDEVFSVVKRRCLSSKARSAPVHGKTKPNPPTSPVADVTG